MKREINYRAWDKVNKRMWWNVQNAYDTLEQHHLPDAEIDREPDHPCLRERSFGELLRSDNYVVMEFTGLKDKNWKKIYEGDIVRWNDTGTLHTCKIVYDPPHYVGKVIERPGVASVWGWFQYDPYVIGNVHENPDLLK